MRLEFALVFYSYLVQWNVMMSAEENVLNMKNGS